jgi:uncharacterized protein
MLRTLALALALAALAPACSRAAEAGGDARPYPDRVRFETGGGPAVLEVAVARTEKERARGLMHVRWLPRDAGMAFVWTEPTLSGFWMKDTLIPLAIAFVDERGRIASIREMRPCRAEPCRVYRSDAPYVMAIEANAGWFERRGVETGDRAVLEVSS